MEALESVKTFQSSPSENPKIIVIYGPTACGKTALSIEVAQYLHTEIISSDSRQIYREMDIGTGKIKKSEIQGIKHHMIDIIDPACFYSVGDFQIAAQREIERLRTDEKIPIICGGTGLYIDTLIYDFSLPKTLNNAKLREVLNSELEEKGATYMYQKLLEIDPVYAREIHPHNSKYVIRGIEVKLLTGKSKTEFQEEKLLKYDTLFLTPYDGNRVGLYERIDERVQAMFREGLVEEVTHLLKIEGWRGSQASESIGYSEIIDFLDNKILLSEAVSLVQKHSRNYAKRQLTWFRKYEGNNWKLFIPPSC